MSKSILVIDTPENCKKCPICHYNELFNSHDCAGYRDWINIEVDYGLNIKSKSCPLILLPGYKNLEQYCNTGIMGLENSVQYAYAQGWNDCIDKVINGG